MFFDPRFYFCALPTGVDRLALFNGRKIKSCAIVYVYPFFNPATQDFYTFGRCIGLFFSGKLNVFCVDVESDFCVFYSVLMLCPLDFVHAAVPI